MSTRRPDLSIAFLWSSALLIAVTLTDDVVLRTLLGVPLILLIAGHVVLCGLGISAATLAEHLTFAAGASIATCVIGGLVLHLAHALNPIGWAVWFWGVVTLASLVATRMRPPIRFPLRGPPSGFGRRHCAALCAAACVAAGALLLAIQQERANRQFAFTEFWLVPEGRADRLVVGARSAEIETRTYDVEISIDGSPLAIFRGVTLRPGASWREAIPVQARKTRQRAEARLVRPADRNVYRSVSAIVLPIAS